MTPIVASNAFPTLEHDHERCLEEALARAQAFEAKGLKLTPLRQRVFGEIAASHRAMGAYEVLDQLAVRGERLAPISIYRALEALVAVGLVHRFESRNAFFACHAAHAKRQRQLVLACEDCGRIAELDGGKVFAAIDRTVGGAGFSPKSALVEVWGLCATCAGERQEPRAWQAVTCAAMGDRRWRAPAGLRTASVITSMIMASVDIRPPAHDPLRSSAHDPWSSRGLDGTSCKASISISARARSLPSSGPTGQARRRWCACCWDLSVPIAARSARAGTDHRLCAAALRRRWSHPTHRRAVHFAGPQRRARGD